MSHQLPRRKLPVIRHPLESVSLLPGGGKAGPEIHHDPRHEEVLVLAQADVELIEGEKVLQVIRVAHVCVREEAFVSLAAGVKIRHLKIKQNKLTMNISVCTKPRNLHSVRASHRPGSRRARVP